MARTSLVELLPPPAPNVREDNMSQAQATEHDQSDVHVNPASAAGEAEPAPAVGAEAGPRYLRMERKEARLRLDQADALAQLTRRLNRARRGRGERITDNTLIRVAVDLLLSQSDRLNGSTEDELREAVTL